MKPSGTPYAEDLLTTALRQCNGVGVHPTVLQGLKVTELARRANMSPSAFHEHFREVTNMSPLQYQKHIRLQEARRLLSTEATDAASVAYQVGYESPSQFSREYRRLFGVPPMRDVERHRNVMPSQAMTGYRIRVQRRSASLSADR